MGAHAVYHDRGKGWEPGHMRSIVTPLNTGKKSIMESTLTRRFRNTVGPHTAHVSTNDGSILKKYGSF